MFDTLTVVLNEFLLFNKVETVPFTCISHSIHVSEGFIQRTGKDKKEFKEEIYAVTYLLLVLDTLL